MPDRYILALDQGTTSSRALLFDAEGRAAGTAQREFTQYFPRPGWVEHDAAEIWSSQLDVARRVLRETGTDASAVEAVGITNQRETTLLWDRATGEAVCPAIVWQDRRTAGICDALREAGHEPLIRRKTGLVLDAYFSGTKLRWMLDSDPRLRARAKAGELAFGTVDSWLIWRLTGGEVHATDPSNASRTLLFDLDAGDWDDELLDLLEVPRLVLPEIRPTSGDFGATKPDLFGEALPIRSAAGDQQAALFGQACFEPGMVKNTYGTGCFLLVPTGPEPVRSESGLLTTVAWGLDGDLTYALEGSIFIAGAAIQWLRDGLRLIDSAEDSAWYASRVEDSDGVYVVPAFAGLGAPHWDMYARGAVFGLTRGTGKPHLVRATLESLAYQTLDVVEAMTTDSGHPIGRLRVDGGAAANDLLMQFQADLLGVPVERPEVLETTARGAAFMAGLPSGFYTMQGLAAGRSAGRVFEPAMPVEERTERIRGWKRAVERCKGWIDPEAVAGKEGTA